MEKNHETITCPECRGGGLVEKKLILLDLCTKCGGCGKICWIDSMTSRRLNTLDTDNPQALLVYKQLTEKNMHMLVLLLKEEVSKLVGNCTIEIYKESSIGGIPPIKKTAHSQQIERSCVLKI